MDTKVKGIVIKLVDYKDADKLAQIFSFEEGIISAKFTGVKKEKAKFKAVAQPFIFADFVLNVKGEHRTVTSVEIIDSFPNLLNDYSRTMVGFVVLDILKRIIPEEKPEQDIFLLTLTALKNLENADTTIALIDFVIKFINLSGMAIEFPNSNYVYLDLSTGNFSQIRTSNSTEIDKKVYFYIKSIYENGLNVCNLNEEKSHATNSNSVRSQNTPLIQDEDDKNKSISAVSQTTKKQALRLIHNILFLKFGVDIKSFDFV